MLKIRYNIKTGMLSGWLDKDFDALQAREGEDTALLDIPMPEADDYEYYAYKGKELVSSGKQPPVPPEPVRDYGAEIDEIKANYDTLKAKVAELEKK